jgi:ABC-type lipoprotein release transport system permease subunit
MTEPALYFLFAFRLLLKARFTLILLVAAVAFGVGFQIPNAANLEGYSRELLNQGMKRALGHVTVTSRLQEWVGTADVITKLEGLPCVKNVATRLIQGAVVLRKGGAMPVRLVGIDIAREKRATNLCARIARGACIVNEDSDVLVGWEAATLAHLEPGQRIEVAVATQDGQSIRKLSLKVVGILHGGGAFQEDRDLIAARLAVLDPLEDVDQLTSILVFGSDAERAKEYRDEIQRIFPKLSVKSWSDGAGFVAQAISGNQTLSYVSQWMVTFAVLVPVLALSYIHVTSERRQIGALRAIGMTRIDILSIYLLKTVVIAMIGATIGAGLGYLVCLYFQHYPIFKSGGFIVVPDLSWKVVLSSMGTVALTTIIAGIWPAMRAALTSPIEELSS